MWTDSSDAAEPAVTHRELVSYVGREEQPARANEPWLLLNSPSGGGMANAIQDAMNALNDATAGPPSRREARAAAPLCVVQTAFWGQAEWTGAPVLALDRHGSAEFTLMSLTVRGGDGQHRSTDREQFSPRYFVPGWPVRPSVAAGDPAIMVVAQLRHLAALAGSRSDTPEAARDAVALLHLVAWGLSRSELPARDTTLTAALRLYQAGCSEHAARARMFSDPEPAPNRHRSISGVSRLWRQPRRQEIPPPIALDLAADELDGLLRAYVELGS